MKQFKIQGLSGLPITFDIHFSKQERSPLVIFLHGFKGFKDWGQWPILGDEMAKNGVSFLRMNFSHNGTTPETPFDFTDLEAFGNNTFTKEIQDVKDVLNWTKSTHELDFSSIHIMAHSRGGAIGMIALNELPMVKSLVTLSGVGNLVRFTDAELAYWKKSGVIYAANGRTKQQMPLRYSLAEDYLKNEKRFAPMEVVKSLKKPYLIIHAENDETVLLKEAKNLSNNGITTSLEVLPLANHSFGGAHPYTEKTLPEHTKMAMQLALNFIKNN
ncbi:MAG: alpha/beta hydrolase family protein [Salibacteraceae bacterium]